MMYAVKDIYPGIRNQEAFDIIEMRSGAGISWRMAYFQ